MTDTPKAAVEQLTNHQRQIDMDGTFVGVSRQALDEVLVYVATLQATVERQAVEIAALRHTLKMIAIVEQGCGGTLTFQEMANSAMSQARKALEDNNG